MAATTKRTETSDGRGEHSTSTLPSQRNAALADPVALTQIRALDLRARVIVEGFMNGLHRSPYHGFSVEFTDYRQYSPGDDLRYLDWKLLARSDRTCIKRFEDETNLRCHILCDFSKSMGYGEQHAKSDYAQTLVATLARFLTLQRDAVGLTIFADQVIDAIPPRFRTGHLRQILGMLDRPVQGQMTDLAFPVTQLANTVSKRGLVILVSDFLAPAEQVISSLKYLAARGHDLILLRVLDPTEVDFKFDQAAMFVDAESGDKLYVDVNSAIESYQSLFSEHENQIVSFAQNYGIEFHRITTDTPFGDALLKVIQYRQQVANSPARTSSRGARQ